MTYVTRAKDVACTSCRKVLQDTKHPRWGYRAYVDIEGIVFALQCPYCKALIPGGGDPFIPEVAIYEPASASQKRHELILSYGFHQTEAAGDGLIYEHPGYGLLEVRPSGIWKHLRNGLDVNASGNGEASLIQHLQFLVSEPASWVSKVPRTGTDYADSSWKAEVPNYRLQKVKLLAGPLHTIASGCGFRVVDADSTSVLYEQTDSETLQVYRDWTWAHRLSSGRITEGKGPESLQSELSFGLE